MEPIQLFPTGALGIADPARLGALGAVAVTTLIALLYVYRRRTYVLHWVCAWTLFTLALAVAAGDYQTPTAVATMLGLSRFFSLSAIILITSSAFALENPPWPNWRYLFGLAPLLTWCVVSPLLLPARVAVLPGYVLSSGLLAAGGLAFLGVLRQAQPQRATVIGVALLLASVTQAWIGISVTRSASGVVPPELMVVNGVLFVLAAVGMHLLVFAEMTFELRMANRRLKETQSELHQQAITDVLTGCHNRRFFHEVIGHELQRHRRYQTPLSLLFVDIDHFKRVNDTLGHEAGDRLLEYVALFLKRNVREADYLFRWGGDEFLLLLSCDLGRAREKAAELTRTFRSTLIESGLPTNVGLSVGCSDIVDHTDDISARVHAADEDMYRNKQESRDGAAS
ncbi:MAG TPA: sensor domain-containing diguanylate cyclase [Acidobacteria bacterium]|nr:sensor domain-containing diguanylate cyclase [Acidobacteriota bacterium]